MRLLKLIPKILFGILCLPLLYLLVALILTFITTENQPECVRSKTIHLSTNGVHAEIIIAVDELSPEFRKGLVIRPEDRYLSFGWGDREFYLNTPEWRDLTIRTAFNATFLKGPSLMHVTRYSHTPDSWIEVPICESQFNEIITYLASSFKERQGQKVLLKTAGYTGRDDFYEARESYSLFFTCNTWVNRGLRNVGLKTPLWTPFEFGVLRNFENQAS